MKKIILGLALAAVAAVSFQVSASPAIVVKEFDCNGFIPNPDTDDGLPPVAGLFTTKTQGVAVTGKVGKVSCYFDHDFPLDKAVSARDFVCAAESPTEPGVMLIADRQVMLAAPGGKAVLQCKFGPAKGKPQR